MRTTCFRFSCFDSRTRTDLSYRVQLAGDMYRPGTTAWLFRAEYNIFNAY